MKKYLFISVLFSMTLFSCNSNSLENEITTVKDSELLSRMTSFNDSILGTRKQSRSLVKPGAWRRAQIIAGDCSGAYGGGKAGAWAGAFIGPQGAAAGAFLGGLLGGVCGSYVAWQANSVRSRAASLEPINITLAKEKTINAYATVLKENNDLSNYTPQKINVDYPLLDENITLMGAKHNIILNKLIDNENIKVTEDAKQQLSEEQIKIINSKEFSDGFNNVIETIYRNVNTGNGMSLKGEDISTKLMNMFYDILIRYPEELNDVEFIINKYIDAVKNTTEISEDDKELIYSGLSVAASSSEFWNEKYN